MAKINCCKDCTDRELGCHGWCERYLAAKNRIAEIHAAKEKQRDIIGYTYSKIIANKAENARIRQNRHKWKLGGRTK